MDYIKHVKTGKIRRVIRWEGELAILAVYKTHNEVASTGWVPATEAEFIEQGKRSRKVTLFKILGV